MTPAFAQVLQHERNIMKLFDYALHHPQDTLAVTDDGRSLRYEELNKLAEDMKEEVGHRLVFVLCRNTPGSLLGYLALLSSGAVPLLLDAEMPPEQLQGLIVHYHPAFCLMPEDMYEAVRTKMKEKEKEEGHIIRQIEDYCLLRLFDDGNTPALHPSLRLLLTTSGSTGGRKLVRISAENLDANAASIVEYLQIDREERPVTVLPMQYSYGMSIINSHVMAGAPILLTRYTLMERHFWERVKEEGATSLCGVPYTFEMYDRLGLTRMDLPSLSVITQAGGRLSEKRQRQFGAWAKDRGIRFYVMYGQTEASPRMSYLPPERVLEKCGSIGIAIPGGRLDLADEKGELIDPAQKDGRGGLVYTGPNVSLGYAECPEDLRKGDERHGILYTGDIARRDADGFYYIVGRSSRFIKVTGRRIGLDEAERLLQARFPGRDIACAGSDDALRVYVAQGGNENTNEKTTPGTSGMPDTQKNAPAKNVLTENVLTNRVLTEEMIAEAAQSLMGIPPRMVRMIPIPEIPRNSSGKVRYTELM